MDDPTDAEIDLLLSHGRLKGAVSDRVRASVLERVSPLRPPRWRSFKVFLPAALALGAMAVVAMMPHPPGGQRSKGGFQSLGQGFLVELACSDGRPDHCPAGARVSIACTGGAVAGLYVGAFAEPEAKGERIWYFSVEDGAAVFADTGGQTRLSSRAIVVGPEHAPGRYRVHVVMSTRPLSRVEVLSSAAPDVVQRAVLPLDVVGVDHAPTRNDHP